MYDVSNGWNNIYWALLIILVLENKPKLKETAANEFGRLIDGSTWEPWSEQHVRIVWANLLHLLLMWQGKSVYSADYLYRVKIIW